MLRTRQGQLVSATDGDAVEAFDVFSARLVRIAKGAEKILEDVKIWPDAACLRLGAAAFYLYGQTGECQRLAEVHLRAVAERMSDLTDWERAWLDALELWHGKAFDAAATRFEMVTENWPEDLMAAKAAEFLYYILGQQHSGPRFRAHMERLAGAMEADADYLAARAFARELCGEQAEARAFAEAALEIDPVVPWAHHCLQHVLLWDGNPDEAVRLMDAWLPVWEGCGRVIHCHNAWHAGLMHLDRLEVDGAWSIFEQHIWGKAPDSTGEQIDAIALLWRMELAGGEVPQARWRDIAVHVIPHVRSVFMPFLSAHHAYALARAGEDEALNELLGVVRRRAMDSDAEATRVWAGVGKDAVEAAAGLGRANLPDQTAALWQRVVPRLTEIGGSDAQDDLFRFSVIEAYRQAGALSAARNLMNDRLSKKVASPLEQEIVARLG